MDLKNYWGSDPDFARDVDRLIELVGGSRPDELLAAAQIAAAAKLPDGRIIRERLLGLWKSSVKSLVGQYTSTADVVQHVKVLAEAFELMVTIPD